MCREGLHKTVTAFCGLAYGFLKYEHDRHQELKFDLLAGDGYTSYNRHVSELLLHDDVGQSFRTEFFNCKTKQKCDEFRRLNESRIVVHGHVSKIEHVFGGRTLIPGVPTCLDRMIYDTSEREKVQAANIYKHFKLTSKRMMKVFFSEDNQPGEKDTFNIKKGPHPFPNLDEIFKKHLEKDQKKKAEKDKN